jgi:hypothetical protein
VILVCQERKETRIKSHNLFQPEHTEVGFRPDRQDMTKFGVFHVEHIDMSMTSIEVTLFVISVLFKLWLIDRI